MRRSSMLDAAKDLQSHPTFLSPSEQEYLRRAREKRERDRAAFARATHLLDPPRPNVAALAKKILARLR